MSEIIRDAYCRAILENNPIPREIDTEYFEDILRRITNIFGRKLEEILENFSLNSGYEELDDYLLEFTIKSCLPKNPLYQGSLVKVTHSCSYGRSSVGDKTYRVFISTQKDNLRIQDSVWVWENKELVDKFMAIDNPYYRKLKMVETIFPLEILYFN